jgi:hypothetical protein
MTSFTSQADLKITIHGAYPSARYFSIAAYSALGTTAAANIIHDTQITPDPDGNFTVTASHSSGPNAISFANVLNGRTGYLMFRVYVPNGAVQLPSLTFTTNSGSVDFAACSSAIPGNSSVGLFNNPDNVYVSFYPPYPFGKTVAVITGLAPTQVRYWSWCSYIWTGAVVDCRYDANIPVSNGYYHIVLGQPGQKNAIVAAGYTYLQYAHRVMLRNLLGNQLTGAYAPVIKTCAITDQVCITG